MPSFLTPRLLRAIALTAEVHGGMTRKGDGLPFLVHPMAVFGLLSRWGADEDTCIAGLLHDTLEDAPEADRDGLRARIEETFGPHVLAIIEGVTEDESLPWVQRKQAYMDKLLRSPRESFLVSCADQTHNTQSLLTVLEAEGEQVWRRFTAPKEVKMEQMGRIAQFLETHLGRQYTEELATTIASIVRRFVEA